MFFQLFLLLNSEHTIAAAVATFNESKGFDFCGKGGMDI